MPARKMEKSLRRKKVVALLAWSVMTKKAQPSSSLARRARRAPRRKR